MLSFKAQIEKLPEIDRVPVIRATRAVLNEVLIEELANDDGNPIRRSILGTALSKAIKELRDYFPEADDIAPMKVSVNYETE